MTTGLTLFWEGKGWWSWPYTAFCLEMVLLFWEKRGVIMAIGLFPLLGREGVVVMVIHICLLRVSSPPLGKGRGGGHGHTQPSAQKFASSSWKREGVIMAIDLLPLLGREGGDGHGHTHVSS